MKNTLLLNYPPSVIGQPVVFTMISRFCISINILRAQVTAEEGWLIIQVEGEPAEVANAVAWLSDQGIDVQENPPLDSPLL